MPDDVDPGARVIRFHLTNENILKKWKAYSRVAADEGLPPGYGTSVFVGLKKPNESDEDLTGRLLSAATASNIDPHRNRYYYPAEAAELLEAGFSFSKSGYPGEVAEHFDVLLGVTPDPEVVGRFTGMFHDRERWRTK